MKDNDLKFMLNAFPRKFKNDIEKIVSRLNFDRFNYHENTDLIKLKDETINLPSRIYYNELSDYELKDFTNIQLRIIYCYFTRHNNGYVRQKNLKKLMASREILKWELPYIFALCGEYIVEIIEDIYANFDILDKDDVDEFIKLNPEFCMLTEGRIASYWGEYYSRYASKKDYIGFKLQKHFKSIRKKYNVGK